MATLGLIGGTGLEHWGEAVESTTAETPWGEPSDELLSFAVGGHQIVFLSRHARDHSIPPHGVNYRANIQALKDRGVDAILAVNAVGGIGDRYGPGVIALPDQLIDYTWGREHTYSDGPDNPLQHIEFADPFTPGMRRNLLLTAEARNIPIVDGGCLGVTQGPRLETSAEVRKLRSDGCDLVGMTTMPEAALAREAAVPYAAIAVVANWAAGLDDEPITEAAIYATLEVAMVHVRALISAFLEQA